MPSATLERDGNQANLILITHFHQRIVLSFQKEESQIFRLGGTAIDSVLFFEGIVLGKISSNQVKVRLFKSEKNYIDCLANLPSIDWDFESDRHCYLYEYYSLDMEGKSSEWIATPFQIQDANLLFINLDFIDGGSNIIKRYRISPFYGTYKLMDNI